MIVITKIEGFICDQDVAEIMQQQPLSKVRVTDLTRGETPKIMPLAKIREVIRGREYRIPDCVGGYERVIIGVSNDVSEALGVHVSALEDLIKDNAELSEQVAILGSVSRKTSADLTKSEKQHARTLDNMKRLLSASFLTRLKWVFTGVHHE